ncbi:MAG TPA: STAS domain-containing protein [Streptosporangiaceae bacterium]|nr:STAS domain-containing protein [Streptosporangiaceae bacterium]
MGPSWPSSTAFGCELAEFDDEVLVTVTGDVDLSAAEEFHECLTDATRPGKPLFIDMTQVEFIDGRGYQAIRIAAKVLPAAPYPPIAVATSSALIAEILEVTVGPLIRVRRS